jgi:hypothetical protein
VDGHADARSSRRLLGDNAPYNATRHLPAPTAVPARSGHGLERARARALAASARCNEASPGALSARPWATSARAARSLMSLLQQGFPQAQMMVCGVLGPKSNAHGPNEFLHVPYGKRLTAAVLAGDRRLPLKAAAPGRVRRSGRCPRAARRSAPAARAAP